MIGHIHDLEVAGEAGIRPYVYVESVDETLERITANGGQGCQARFATRNGSRAILLPATGLAGSVAA